MFSSLNLQRFIISKIHRSMSTMVNRLKYDSYGDPIDVIKMITEEISDIGDNELLVKVLMAPINPADINTIQGKYPVKVSFPSSAGNEFVGEIIAVGKNVQSFQIGDHVIPYTVGLGTWSTHLKENENKFFKVPKNLGLVEAATLTVNPCTAYRMLKDFINLKSNDVVIQNGANSAVGQAVHQLCRIWGIKSIGVVRNRTEIDNLRTYLKSLGANEILIEEELRTTDIFKNKYKKPILALNCIGGKSATEIARYLDNGGYHITYGGMSREPVNVSTASLIFKDLRFCGYWMTRWSLNSNKNERNKMLNELCDYIIKGKMEGPVHQLVPFVDYKIALENAINFKGFSGKKFLLDLR